MSDSSLLEGLNPQQREAVVTTEGPVLVIAGAGSGKTRVITRRITYLIDEKGVSPWEIFAATFTNKAAREMKHRVAQLCRSVDTQRLPVATFHSQCVSVLRHEAAAVGLSPKFSICDDTDQTGLLRDCINALGHSPKILPPASVREVISLAKMRLIEGEDAWGFIETIRDKDQADIYLEYQRRLRASDAVDFDDLLLLVVRLWSENPQLLESYQRRFRYVLVDEYQDTNLAQFELVRLLTQSHHNLCVVGDEDQSIYSWRGAEITNLLEFKKHFPEAKIIRLEQNYRSTGTILDAASAVIARNTQRLGKELWTEDGAGDPIVEIDAENEYKEARQIVGEIVTLHAHGLPLDEIALFYRVNSLSRVYEEVLRECRVPYQVIGGVGFYDRAEIKDLLAYLQVIANPGNALSLLRILNAPKRGIGKSAEQKLLTHADSLHLSLFEILLSPTLLREAGLKGKAAEAAQQLANWFVEWTAQLERLTFRELVEDILHKTDYEAALGDPKSIEVLSRKENIREFLGALEQFESENPEMSLANYLETVVLRQASDQPRTGEERGVSLMTVHNAKGLEFDVVFLVALEKDLFPNARAVRDQGHSEEERRLFYVAITRARRRLYISHAQMRRLYGEVNWPTPSQFLFEIPDSLRVKLEDADLPPLRRRKTEPVPLQKLPDTPRTPHPARETAPRPSESEGEGKTSSIKTPVQPTTPTQPESSSSGQSESSSARPPNSSPRTRGQEESSRSETPSSSPPPPPAAPQLFFHKLLGEVEILEERGVASQRRFIVRDARGAQHTLMAAYANLIPLQTPSPAPSSPAATSLPEPEEDLPF